MESLVKKLKGAISDPALRKINEVAIKFEVFKMKTDSTGSSNEIKAVLSNVMDISVRTPNDITVTPSNNGRTFNWNNIKDGDKIFVGDARYINNMRYDGGATSEGFKPIRMSFEGIYPEKISADLFFNNIIADFDTIPASTLVTAFTVYSNTLRYYLPSYDVDFTQLSQKYPNIQTIIIHDTPAVLLNVSALKNFSRLSRVDIYSLNDSQDIDVSSFENLVYANLFNIQAHGDYFKMIDGKEKSVFSFSGTFQYNGETFEGSKFSQIGGDNFFVIGDVDTMLNNMANNATRASSGGNNTIRISSYRTSASDSAIQKLQSKGWTVSIPIVETLSANTLSSINTMSLINSEENAKLKKYRIAYQGKEIIITPTEFPIYPAAGVTVKEFQTLEEANGFISENNLSTDVE